MKANTSVIVCSYNYARFLPRCLESVMSQTRPADEIIVVDDGSQDETSLVMKRFPAVRYIRQEHAGKAAAFNRGFLASQGDLICHLDADDYWLPEKLERVTESLTRHDAGGVFHDAFYVDGEGNYLYRSNRDAESKRAPHHLSLRQLLLQGFIYRPLNAVAGVGGVSNTICVRKEAVADLLPLPAELGLAVDGALMLSAARRGLIQLPDKLSAYRHHGNNSFASTPGSQEFQHRLYKWAADAPGAVQREDKDLLEALDLEVIAHWAVHNGREPLKGACNATALAFKLISLGLVPHWKHFALPVASLVRWGRIRHFFFRANGN